MTETGDIIETIDENGDIIKFTLFDIFDFEGRDYAVLVPVDPEAEKSSEDADIVIMRLITEGEEYSFEVIDDEDEFERVTEYLDAIDEEE